tara:strand:+ start:1691 stop:3682 length:1992 start_codon:yes stop_codon:yes gene_type:complete
MKLSYRPEIDGLRAIAVVSVILYHAQFKFFDYNFFTGGFIGVDIFFVISGYLISSLIFKELSLTGNFSFAHFYERRVRRILPVLFFIMLISILFAWIYLLPIPFVDYANSILSSIFFISNFYFHYTGTIYGAEIGLLKPFLHTWSLSVEEQFYLIFPVFIFLCFKFIKQYVTLILILGFILSLVISHWGSYNYPSFNFYSLPTRSWELLAGVFLAKLEMNYTRSKNRYLNEILTLVGFVLIGCSIIYFDEKTLHPSLYTLCPIIGVMLILWFSNEKEFITKLLSSKLFVGTGLISYSLYLWHFPLLAFARTKHPLISDYDKFEILILIIILSIITFFLIEKPFRNKKIINSKFLIFTILLLIVSYLSFYTLTIKSQGFEDRLHVFLKKELKTAPWETLTNNGNMCFDRKNNHCSFNKQYKKKLYLIGDSSLESISSTLLKKLNNKKINLIDMNRTGCFYMPGFNQIAKKTKKIIENCNVESQEKIKLQILSNKNSIVMIGALYKYYLRDYTDNFGPNELINQRNDESILDSFILSVAELLENGVKVVIVYPIPNANFNVAKKLMRDIPKKTKNASEYMKKNPITTSFKSYKDENKDVLNALDKFEHKNLIKIYPSNVFCNTLIKGRCLTHGDKNIYFFDSHHLSKRGAEMLVNEIYNNTKELF